MPVHDKPPRIRKPSYETRALFHWWSPIGRHIQHCERICAMITIRWWVHRHVYCAFDNGFADAFVEQPRSVCVFVGKHNINYPGNDVNCRTSICVIASSANRSNCGIISAGQNCRKCVQIAKSFFYILLYVSFHGTNCNLKSSNLTHNKCNECQPHHNQNHIISMRNQVKTQHVILTCQTMHALSVLSMRLTQCKGITSNLHQGRFRHQVSSSPAPTITIIFVTRKCLYAMLCCSEQTTCNTCAPIYSEYIFPMRRFAGVRFVYMDGKSVCLRFRRQNRMRRNNRIVHEYMVSMLRTAFVLGWVRCFV